MINQTRQQVYSNCHGVPGRLVPTHTRGPISGKQLRKINNAAWRVATLLELAFDGDDDGHTQYYWAHLAPLRSVHTTRGQRRLLRAIESHARARFPRCAAATDAAEAVYATEAAAVTAYAAAIAAPLASELGG